MEKEIKNLTSFDDFLVEELKDSETREIFEREYLKIQLVNEIVNLRKKSNMTQLDLAKISGIPQSNISRFESGKVEPTLDFLEKIVAKLGYKINFNLEKMSE